jgi:hypothetical protein
VCVCVCKESECVCVCEKRVSVCIVISKHSGSMPCQYKNDVVKEALKTSVRHHSVLRIKGALQSISLSFLSLSLFLSISV